MKQQLYELELSLLEPSTRRSVPYLNQLIADNFVEFGSSGKVYNKRDILNWLPLETEQVAVSVKDFKVIELSNDVIQATYTLTVKSPPSLKCSLRSSIWRQNKEGWQMIFHQGTRCEEV